MDLAKSCPICGRAIGESGYLVVERTYWYHECGGAAHAAAAPTAVHAAGVPPSNGLPGPAPLLSENRLRVLVAPVHDSNTIEELNLALLRNPAVRAAELEEFVGQTAILSVDTSGASELIAALLQLDGFPLAGLTVTADGQLSVRLDETALARRQAAPPLRRESPPPAYREARPAPPVAAEPASVARPPVVPPAPAATVPSVIPETALQNLRETVSRLSGRLQAVITATPPYAEVQPVESAATPEPAAAPAPIDFTPSTDAPPSGHLVDEDAIATADSLAEQPPSTDEGAVAAPDESDASVAEVQGPTFATRDHESVETAPAREPAAEFDEDHGFASPESQQISEGERGFEPPEARQLLDEEPHAEVSSELSDGRLTEHADEPISAHFEELVAAHADEPVAEAVVAGEATAEPQPEPEQRATLEINPARADAEPPVAEEVRSAPVPPVDVPANGMHAQTDGQVQVVAYPFENFAVVNSFIGALRRLPDVHNVAPRRFRGGTIQLAVDYSGGQPFSSLLGGLTQFEPRIVADEGAMVEVALGAGQ